MQFLLATLKIVLCRRQFSKMAVLSRFALRNIKKLNVAKIVIGSLKYECRSKVWNDVPMRNCHKKTLTIKPTQFEFKTFKDMLNLYTLLGIIPIIVLVTYINIFIGPATLALIPEGYEPKPWEYHRHPITRFLAKYIIKSPQESHERNLHNLFFENEKKELKLLRNKILEMIRRKQDYQSWYFEKAEVKYVRKAREEFAESGNKKNILYNWVY